MLTAALVLVAAVGCAESSAEVNTPSAWETKVSDPAFARAAEGALLEAPAPASGWRNGVVAAEDKDGYAITAMTTDGVVYIAKAWKEDGCDRAWDIDQFDLTLAPGDLITWAGDGRTTHHVCVEDLRVLRKAAA